MNELRFFTDQCVPSAINQALQQKGYEVLRLRDHIPCDSPDPVVIATAQQFDAILVTLNGDFSDIVTYPPSEYKGIIAIQLHNHPEILPPLILRLINYLFTYPNKEHYQGKLLLVEVHRIRIRQ